MKHTRFTMASWLSKSGYRIGEHQEQFIWIAIILFKDRVREIGRISSGPLLYEHDSYTCTCNTSVIDHMSAHNS